MHAIIKAIEYALPDQILTNEELAKEYGDWTADKILQKTGIANRRIAAEDQCSSDLALEAANRLFSSGVVAPKEIDFLLFCTQSPDYFLPTTACILQDRLGLRNDIGALDFNLGCSGFVYGLALVKTLIESRLVSTILLITAETYSKFIHPGDKSVRTIFGDGAAAILIRGMEVNREMIGPFVFGTDGRGHKNLIVPNGGLRRPHDPNAPLFRDDSDNTRTDNNLFMNGPEIFAFTLREVPRAVNSLLKKTGLSMEDIDLFVFHQANAFMIETLRRKVGIPKEKFFVWLRDCGNTVSSTIPIALKEADIGGRLKSGDLVMLVGFGVGYSWGAVLVRWE